MQNKIISDQPFSILTENMKNFLASCHTMAYRVGMSTFQTFLLFDQQNHKLPLLLKAPLPGRNILTLRNELLFSKKNMGEMFPPFNFYPVITIGGQTFYYSMLQKLLIDFHEDMPEQFRLGNKTLNMIEKETELLTKTIKRGIYYPDSWIHKNYGLDAESEGLLFVDHGGAYFADVSQVFEKDIWGTDEIIFFKLNASIKLRSTMPSNAEIRRLWGTEKHLCTAVPDINPAWLQIR
ncbi:MAG: hypothetical protein PHV30_04035 [Candidatus Margulisbacteria bacterium]|nr:hypothetical protein [Candidatus Margulisiibacteriota bacterium]